VCLHITDIRTGAFKYKKLERQAARGRSASKAAIDTVCIIGSIKFHAPPHRPPPPRLFFSVLRAEWQMTQVGCHPLPFLSCLHHELDNHQFIGMTSPNSRLINFVSVPTGVFSLQPQASYLSGRLGAIL